MTDEQKATGADSIREEEDERIMAALNKATSWTAGEWTDHLIKIGIFDRLLNNRLDRKSIAISIEIIQGEARRAGVYDGLMMAAKDNCGNCKKGHPASKDVDGRWFHNYRDGEYHTCLAGWIHKLIEGIKR